MRERQQMNIAAQQQYLKEKEQIDAIIQKTIAEDIKYFLGFLLISFILIQNYSKCQEKEGRYL